MRLKDRLVHSDTRIKSEGKGRSPGESPSGGKDDGGVDVNDICRCYNRGRCSF